MQCTSPTGGMKFATQISAQLNLYCWLQVMDFYRSLWLQVFFNFNPKNTLNCEKGFILLNKQENDKQIQLIQSWTKLVLNRFQDCGKWQFLSTKDVWKVERNAEYYKQNL